MMYNIAFVLGNKSPQQQSYTSSHSHEQQQNNMDKRFRPFQVKQWQHFLEEAKAFRKKHGHCLISSKSNADKELAKWAKRQRYHYKQYKKWINGISRPGTACQITPERIAALNDIGFSWDAHEVVWEERYNELMEFRKLYGHLNVPNGPRGMPRLATWIKAQRRQYKLRKEGKIHSITATRIEKLRELGLTMETERSKKKNS